MIRLSEGLVPVDAKFPLESFRRLMESGTTRKSGEIGQFRRDVKRHVDAIADRYICPGETLDFALMYVPAENVYYEIVLKEEGQNEILTHAWSRRVFPTSPNSFYAFLQVIAFGLRGLQVEQSAREILESLSRLQGDFARFADDFRLVGRHLGNAKSKYDEGLPKLESIQGALRRELTYVGSDRALEGSDPLDPDQREEIALVDDLLPDGPES